MPIHNSTPGIRQERGVLGIQNYFREGGGGGLGYTELREVGFIKSFLPRS